MTRPLPLHPTPALDNLRPDLMTITNYGRSVADFVGNRLTTCSMNRSITQASTIAMGFADPHRELMNSPLLNQAVTLAVGTNPDLQFTLVQVTKSKDIITAAFEDAVVHKLRNIKGQRASAPYVHTRASFARQLCDEAKVPCIIPPPGLNPPLREPLTRGTSQNPTEDTWSCLVRLAQDVAYRCFSDGFAVWFGPDSWLLTQTPMRSLSEFSDDVDYIDFDYDVGKPVGTAKVFTYSPRWKTAPGGVVWLNQMAAATGKYLVTDIGRDLFHTPTTVSLVAAQPALPEPVPSK